MNARMLANQATRKALAPVAVCNVLPRVQAQPLPHRLWKASRRQSASVQVRATADDSSVDVDQVVKDLQEKWDRVENKTTVLVYAGGSIIALWLSSSIVGAVNAVPLLPKFLELVGLGYTSWFVYRYLLFKNNRQELLSDIDELKRRISGASQDTAASINAGADKAKSKVDKI